MFFIATKMNILNDDGVADVLGISAIVVNDLKQKRKKDYNFSWESALQVCKNLINVLQNF